MSVHGRIPILRATRKHAADPAGAARFAPAVLATLSLVLGSAGPVRAQCVTPVRIPAPQFEVRGVPAGVASADLDADGDIDLAISSNWGVNILLNRGDGTFDFSAGSLQYLGYGGIAIADMDSDGDPDIVAAWSGPYVLLNQGNGVFVNSGHYGISGLHSIALGDVDGDGDADVVTGIAQEFPPYPCSFWPELYGLYVWKNNGDGTLGAPEAHGQGCAPIFGVAVRSGGAWGAHYNYNFVFQDHVCFDSDNHVGVGAGPISMASGDLDGNGTEELVVANQLSNNLSVIGVLGAPVPHTYPTGINPSAVAIGDLDLDGDRDIVVLDRQPPTGNGLSRASVLRNNGQGLFTNTGSFPVGALASAVTIADFDGDLKPDLAVTVNDYYPGSGQNYSVTILHGRGNGTFEAPAIYPASQNPRSVTLGDLDGDGRADVISANANSDTVSVFRAQADGTLSAPQSYAVGTYPVRTALGDLDADGHADMAVVNGSGLSVLRNNGDGTFALAVTYGTSSSPYAVAIANMDADSYPDLVVGHSYYVSLLRNRGDGTFELPVVSAPGGGVGVDMAVGDLVGGGLIGDGRPDVAVCANDSFPSHFVSVYANNGDGTLAVPDQKAWSTGAVASLAITDVDRDGDRDLLLGVKFGGPPVYFGVHVFRNNGDGSFSGSSYPYTGSFHSLSPWRPDSLAVADLNWDGWPDLAVGNGGTYSNNVCSIAVLYNQHDGTFSLPEAHAAGSHPLWVAAGDIDGDGDMDLATANSPYDEISVLLNEADHSGSDCDSNGIPDGCELSWNDCNGNGILDACEPGGVLPVITQQPSNASVVAGQAVSFSVAASSSSPLSYRWRKAGANLSDGASISGATTSALTIDPSSTADAGNYDVVVTNSCGATTSAPAALTVAPASGTPFCSGDGSATPCPCGNDGAAAHGCASSVNVNGAHLVASGDATLSGDTLLLSGSGMTNSFVMYFQGTTQQNGGLGSIFGDGLRCAGGAVLRLGVELNSDGSSQYPDGGDLPISVKGDIGAPGLRTYQGWYRDGVTFCTPSTFNLTNGVLVNWIP